MLKEQCPMCGADIMPDYADGLHTCSVQNRANPITLTDALAEALSEVRSYVRGPGGALAIEQASRDLVRAIERYGEVMHKQGIGMYSAPFTDASETESLAIAAFIEEQS